MAEKRIIKKTALSELFAKWKADGKRIAAPVEKNGRIDFGEVESFDETAQDYVQTTLSAKKYMFPQYEEILNYRRDNGEITIGESAAPQPTVVFGLRPCDARGFAALNEVFTWDYEDAFFTARRDNTVLVTMSCAKSDEFCFCTSVGGGPGDTFGSDVLLTPMGEDKYLAEIVTEKGKTSFAPVLDQTEEADEAEKDKYIAEVPARFDVKNLTERLTSAYDSDIWQEQSLRCLGCGACSFVCPACVCFDIQDEACGDSGIRYRCWDSCGFSQFTLHTSGHNPRDTQGMRWRHRVMHKFAYQPERHNFVGCTGCGRCSRACPADMNLCEHLEHIVEATA